MLPVVVFLPVTLIRPQVGCTQVTCSRLVCMLHAGFDKALLLSEVSLNLCLDVYQTFSSDLPDEISS